LDKYVGTWIWEENGNKLTVVLQKSLMHNMYDRYQADILVGNYKYEENGALIVDTMTNPMPNPNLIEDIYYLRLSGYFRSPTLMSTYGNFRDPVQSQYAGYDLRCLYIEPLLVDIGSTQTMEPIKMRWVIIATGYNRSSIDEVIDTTRPFMPRVPNDVNLVKQ